MRLVGGHLENEGQVEMCFEGRWGTISDDGWSTSDAEVVCRQLGYSTQSELFDSAIHACVWKHEIFHLQE